MIFKTFDSENDKVSSKWGLLGRSFNDIGTAIIGRIKDIKNSFHATDDLFGSFHDSDGILKRLYPSKDSIQSQLIDVDSLYPKIDKSAANNILNHLQQQQKSVDLNKGSWQNYFNKLKEYEKWQIGFVQKTDLQKASTDDVIKANQEAREAALAHNAALKQQTLGAKAASAGMKALSIAGNLVAGIAVAKGIEWVVTSISNYVNSSNIAKEKTEALSSSLSEAQSKYAEDSKKIGELSSRYETLSKGVNHLGQNVSLSSSQYDEYKSVIQQLSDIMPDLTLRFNEQGEAIGFVGGKLTDANKKYQEYQKNQARDFLVNGDSEGNTYQDALDNLNNQLSDKRSVWQKMANNAASVFGGEAENNFKKKKKINILQEIVDTSNNAFGRSDAKRDVGKLISNNLMSQKYGKYDSNAYQELIGKSELDILNLKPEEFTQFIEQISQKIEKYQMQYDSSANPIKQSMRNVALSKDEYWSDKLGDSGREKVNALLSGITTDFLGNNDLTTEESQAAFVQKLIDSIAANKGGISEAFGSLFELNIDDMSVDEARTKIQEFCTIIAKALGISLDEVQKNLGYEEFFKTASNYDRVVAYASGGNYKSAHDIKNSKGYDKADVVEAMKENSINTDEEINKFRKLLDTTTSLNEAIDAYKRSSATPSTFQQTWDSIGKSGDKEADNKAEEAKGKLLELAKAGKLTEEALKKSSLAKIFTDAGFSIEEATKKINNMKFSADQLSSMETGISSISSILGEKEENKGISSKTLAGMPEDVKAQTKEYEHFVEVLGKGKSKMDDCYDAATKLATAYLKSNNFLANLTDDNEDSYISLLEDMGVENAADITKNALNKQEDSISKKKVNNKLKTFDVTNATEQEISTLGDYITTLDDSCNSLGYYTLQHQIANNNALDTSDSISNLQKLAEKCGVTGEAISIMASLITDMKSLETGSFKDKVDAKHVGEAEEHIKGEIASGKKRLNKILKKGAESTGSPEITLKGSSNTKGKGEDSNNKTNKSTFDWIERRLKNLQNTIDFTASKLQNLFSVNTKANNLKDQIKTTTKLINGYGAAAKKYQQKANQIATPKTKTVKGKNGKKKKVTEKGLSKNIVQKIKTGKLTQNTKPSSLIQEYGEEDAGKIQSYIDYTDKAREARKNQQEQIAKKRNLKQDLYQTYVDRADGKISLYEQQKENAGTAEKKNTILGNELKQYKESYQYQIKIAALTKATTEQARLRSEYEKKITDLRKEQLQNTLDENSDKNNLLEARLANATTAEDKNQILDDEIGIVHSDTAAYNKNYSDAISNRSNQAKTASTSIKKDKSKNLKKSDKEKIKSYISRNEPIPDNLINKCSPKTQEQLANYNASLNWVEDALNKKNLNDEESKTKERELQIQQHENLADQYQSDFDSLAAKKENQKNAKDKNETIDRQKALATQIYNEKKQAAHLEGNSSKEEQLQEEHSRDMVAFEKEKFDNIAHDYQNLMKLKNNSYKNLSNIADEIEARGLIVGASLYTSQIQLNNEKKAGYKEELKALEAQLPQIEEGTDEWYDAQDAIQACEDGIAETTKNTIELNKAIREIPFLLNEKISTRLDLVSSEFELINKFMSNKKMFDDKTGNFTKEGTATLAAYYNQLLLAQEKTKDAKTAVEDMLAAIERGDEGYEDKDLAMQEYYERYDEYLKLAGSELDIQQKLIDMMKEKYQAELDHLKDIIDKRKELLDTEKEAYDYQKTIEEKTKNIGSLTKQLEASKGDDSEAGKLKLQQLQVSLDEARQDLQDTEYDKWITDQKEMLDKLYNDYSAFIDDKLNDTDSLLQEAIEYLEDPATKKEFLDTWDTYMNKHDFDPENDLTLILNEIGKDGSIVSAINNLSNIVSYYYELQQKTSGVTSNDATIRHNDNAIVDSPPPAQSSPAPSQDTPAQTPVEYVTDPATTFQNAAQNKILPGYIQSLVDKYQKKATLNRDEYGLLNRYIYGKTKGKIVVRKDRFSNLAMGLGLPKTATQSQILQVMKNAGYSTGGFVETLQKVPGMNGDDGWATLKRGEAVLTPEQTKQFQKLAENLDVLNSAVNILPNLQKQNYSFVPNHNTTQSIGDVNIEMEFPNVTNYEDFRQKMQSDPIIEKYVKSVIWDKGDLSKYKINM